MQIDVWAGSGLIKGIALLYMGVCAAVDIRHKEIPLWLILLGMAAALGVNLWWIEGGAATVAEAAFSLVPGIFLLLTGFCTGEKVGYGDGLLLLILGLLLGAYRCFLVLCIGLVLSAAVSLCLLLFYKADRQSRLAFAPFLTLGMGVVFFG